MQLKKTQDPTHPQPASCIKHRDFLPRQCPTFPSRLAILKVCGYRLNDVRDMQIGSHNPIRWLAPLGCSTGKSHRAKRHRCLQTHNGTRCTVRQRVPSPQRGGCTPFYQQRSGRGRGIPQCGGDPYWWGRYPIREFLVQTSASSFGQLCRLLLARHRIPGTIAFAASRVILGLPIFLASLVCVPCFIAMFMTAWTPPLRRPAAYPDPGS